MDISEEFELIHSRLDEVVRLLREQQQAAPAPAQQQQPQQQSPGDVLSLVEAAAYLGIQPRTLRDRKTGTGTIPRYSNHPVKFLRANLDQFKRRRVEQGAIEGQQRVKQPRRLSLIRRKKSA